MSLPVRAASVREILVKHDPLASWPAAGPNPDGYQAVAERTADGLVRMLGLGHAWTVVTDAIDLEHPGFYRAARAGDPELTRRIGLVAREIWDRHANIVPRPPAVRTAAATPSPTPPPAALLLADPALLEGWLRAMEVQLEGETGLPVAERAAAKLMQSVLSAIVDAYFEATDGEREGARLAFSRFRLCCYQLGGFAGRQLANLEGPDPDRALRQALTAESLLDMQLDWRDELLLIQDLKRRAGAMGLAYGDRLEEAAARSSARTGEFLRQA